ncbi:MAG: hypothetical protein HGA75_17960 [Thiobacillus sp.]|nr:hypothetical protein [Thiobacillus sp.]
MPTPDRGQDEYFVLMSHSADRMLLGGVPMGPGGTSWTMGQRFPSSPSQPVPINVVEGYEEEGLPEFENVPPVMSTAVYKALLNAGVDNIDAYDAVLRSKDGSIEHAGFKAYNLIGLISATDFRQTAFSASNPSRSIDAAIDSLVIDPARARGVLMFRLAENTSTILVHRRVKETLEAAGFETIYFMAPPEYMTL